jgi:hypothetical protein
VNSTLSSHWLHATTVTALGQLELHAVCARLTCSTARAGRGEIVVKCISLLSSPSLLMLFLYQVLFELIVKIVSLHIVSRAPCHLSTEYTEAVLEVAAEFLTIAESFYTTRAVVPTRV